MKSNKCDGISVQILIEEHTVILNIDYRYWDIHLTKLVIPGGNYPGEKTSGKFSIFFEKNQNIFFLYLRINSFNYMQYT